MKHFCCLMLALAPMVSAGVVSRIPGQAQRKIAPGAARSRPEAEDVYRRGKRFAASGDYKRAADFYRQAAEAGYAAAQYDLGYLYENGLGVETSPPNAAFWYRKAAEQGDPEAQNNLGALYAAGNGVARDDAEAVRWYAMAAEQDDAEAASNLGAMYLQGRGVSADLARAYRLTERAAAQGNAAAQNNLGLMYANGQSVERDFAWAYVWLDLAADRLASSSQLRDRIAQEMTQDQLARARKLLTDKRAELATSGNARKIGK